MNRNYLTLKEIQQEELNIALEIDLFCKNNNLKYFLASGTLIGAVRHKGFIPWDDDMDLIMLREDFDFFCKNFKIKGLVVKCCQDGTLHAPFAKVCNRNIAVDCENLGDEDNSLLWVDIFPIDAINPNSIVDKIKTLFLRRLMRDISLNRLVNYSKKNNFFKNLVGMVEYKYCSKITAKGIARRAKIISDVSKENKPFTTGFLGFRIDKFYWPEEVFKKRKLYQFENAQLYSVMDFDSCLRIHYGDYMTLPPENQRASHHMRAYYV